MATIRFEIVILLILFCKQIGCATYSNFYQLQNDLLQNYSTTIRPVVNQSLPVNVNVTYMLKSLNDFDVAQGRLTLVGAFTMTWIDENINWTPSSYGDLNSIGLSYKNVWTPDIIILNGADSMQVTNGHTTNVVYTNGGLASFTMSGITILSCNPYIKFYPNDKHTCPIQIGFMETLEEVTLTALTQTILSPNIEGNAMWKYSYEGNEKVTGSVPSALQFNLVLERRAAYLMLALVVPVMILYMMNLVVFILPPETEERLGYGMTILLTLTVYMGVMSEGTPGTSDPVSVLSASLLMKIVCSVMIVLANIMVRSIYNRPEEKPIPQFVKFIFFRAETRKIQADTKHTIQNKHFEVVELPRSPKSKGNIGNANSKAPEEGSSKEDNPGSKVVISWESVGKKLDVIFGYFFMFACIFDVTLTLVLIIFQLE